MRPTNKHEQLLVSPFYLKIVMNGMEIMEILTVLSLLMLLTLVKYMLLIDLFISNWKSYRYLRYKTACV